MHVRVPRDRRGGDFDDRFTGPRNRLWDFFDGEGDLPPPPLNTTAFIVFMMGSYPILTLTEMRRRTSGRAFPGGASHPAGRCGERHPYSKLAGPDNRLANNRNRRIDQESTNR